MIDPGARVKWNGASSKIEGVVEREHAPGYYVVRLKNGRTMLLSEDNIKEINTNK